MRCRTAFSLLALLAVAACGGGDDSEVVRMILPHGDAEAGRRAFVDLQCPACHVVGGIEGLPPVEIAEPGPDLAISLRGLSRGAIATSVLAPAHVNVETVELWTDWTPEERIWLGPGANPATERIDPGPSRMRDYGAVLTVRQLSDLVTFLRESADN